MTRHRVLAMTAMLAAAAIVALLLLLPADRPVLATPSRSTSIDPDPVLSAAQRAALPEARYDAVIGSLLPAPGKSTADTAYRLRQDSALYAADRVTAIARLEARDFLGEPTVVVPVESWRGWVRVLTPARQRLPSDAGDAGQVPAQTSAWLRADALVDPTPLASQIVVSVSAQTLRIVGVGDHTWPVGVGAPGTPTPTGVTGYLEARYRDAAQGQAEHPVQLTSLHSTAADEPFGGDDGGLIGIHFGASSVGAVSHGCVRVPVEALAAVDGLPLGTLISIEE